MVHNELGSKVPCDVTRKRLLEPLVEWVGVLTVDLNLAEERELDPVLGLDILLDLVLRA